MSGTDVVGRTAAQWGLALVSLAFWAGSWVVLVGCSKQSQKQETGDALREGSREASSGQESPVVETTPAEGSKSKTSGRDVLTTSQGNVTIIPIHHGTLALQFAGKTLWVDPWSEADLQAAPAADYIFITDLHRDHLDPEAVEKVSKEGTVIVGPQVVRDEIESTLVMKNGDRRDFSEFSVEATPMYNLQRGPQEGQVFHEKGRGNGYLFAFGDKRLYLAGDTECTQEMRGLSDIDVAFLPMNLPYTMPPQEAVECVRSFRPQVVYPYHYRGSDLSDFAKAVEDLNVEVRLRDWY